MKPFATGRSALLLGVVLVGVGACAPKSGSSPETGGQSGSGTPGTGGAGVGSTGGATGIGGGNVSATGGAIGTGGAAVAATGGATGTGGAGGGGGTGGRPGGADAGAAPDASAPDASTADASTSDGAGRDAATSDASASDAVAGDARTDGGGVASTCNTAGAAGAQTPIVYVIGDSTASVYATTLFPRMGWAQPFQDFFAPACATIQDKALSGRSSKSFFDEGAWTPIRTALRAGDYVLIQFGHNDEKIDDPTLGTDPFTTYQQFLTTYIDDTLAKGATPILLTSINRNSWSNGLLQDTHGDYPVAVRQLAQARQVTLVDATALTKTYFERIGQAATTLLFMDLAVGQFPNYPAGNVDNTHLQEVGARTIGRMILADLYRQGKAPGTLAKVVPVAP